jgi:hypothetical protein
MVRINLEKIIDENASYIRRALESAVEEACGDVEIDAHELFRAFKRAIRRKGIARVTVTDQCIEG